MTTCKHPPGWVSCNVCGAVSADGPSTATEPAPKFPIALNTRHPDSHKAADAFWKYWEENGETHRHGYYESTWGAINRALRTVGVVPHDYGVSGLLDSLEAAQDEAGEAARPDPQLCKFYAVSTFPELVAAMEYHIAKLQAKLPEPPSFAPQIVREG
jgi:hypothetical protein